MVVFPRFGYEPGSSVLYSLEFGKKVVGNNVNLCLVIVLTPSETQGLISQDNFKHVEILGKASATKSLQFVSTPWLSRTHGHRPTGEGWSSGAKLLIVSLNQLSVGCVTTPSRQSW